jgi:hypothetical protein
MAHRPLKNKTWRETLLKLLKVTAFPNFMRKLGFVKEPKDKIERAKNENLKTCSCAYTFEHVRKNTIRNEVEIIILEERIQKQ